jgi:hypothetical protein
MIPDSATILWQLGTGSAKTGIMKSFVGV